MAEGAGQHNGNVVFVNNQNITTNIKGSNIESLALGQENKESTGATNPPHLTEGKVNWDMIGDVKRADVTWLSWDVVMFNKQRVSRQPNAKVYHGRQQLGKNYRDVAIKLIQYSDKNMKEIETLAKLNHPNIVQIYCAGEISSAGHYIYIVMELCLKNLEEYVNETPPDPKKSSSLFNQLVAAVDFMHEKSIAHLDVKPSNILLSKCGTLKFSDFGISKEIPQGATSVTGTSQGAGTEGYKPPELYKPGCKVSLSSDIFSLGLVAAYLFSSGKHPFGDDAHDWSYNIRKNRGFDLSGIPVGIHKRQQLIDLLKRMLQNVPLGRPTMQEITRDAFFSGTHNSAQSIPVEGIEAAANANEHNRSGVGEKATDLRSDGREQTDTRRHEGDVETDPEHRAGIALFDDYSCHMHCYNPQMNTITKMHAFNDVMKDQQFQAVTISNSVYVFMPNREIYSLVYYEAGASWVKRASFPQCHHHLAPAIGVSGKLFLIGNLGAVGRKSVSMYDPLKDYWKELPYKQNATIQSAFVVVKSFLYCIGGSLKNVERNSVERMDLQTFIWDQLEPIQERVRHASAVGYREKIFIMGGVRSGRACNSLDMYDPQSTQWTKLSPMSKARFHISSYCINDRIYIIQKRPGSSLEIEEYNIDQNTWRVIPQLSDIMLHVSASTLMNMKSQ